MEMEEEDFKEEFIKEIKEEFKEEEMIEEEKVVQKVKLVVIVFIFGILWCVVWIGDEWVFFYNFIICFFMWDWFDDLIGRVDVDKIIQEFFYKKGMEELKKLRYLILIMLLI